jgi:four helix bundle protein
MNIAEGAVFGRSPSYSRHLAIAYGSAVETGELIELLGEIEILPRQLLDDLARHSELSQKLLVGLLKLHRPLR